MNRREIQNKHEQAVLAGFADYQTSQGRTLKVIARPDPPDAIVTIDGKKTWIELTNAYFSQSVAKSITSFAADEMEHMPVPLDERNVLNPSDQVHEVLEKVIVRKYDKKSIGSVYHTHGGGILLVGLYGPFFDPSGVSGVVDSEKARLSEVLKTKEPRFDEVFLFSSNPWDFRVLYPI